MSKTKRILAFALAAVLAVVVLTGCKSIAQKVFGSSNEVQEDDTTQWAVLSSDPLMIDGIADTTAKYATARANGALNIVFNGIWSRQTEYFTVPGGSLTITGYGTAEHLRLRHHRRRCPEVQGLPLEKGGRRRAVCGQHHLLFLRRRPELPLRHRQP